MWLTKQVLTACYISVYHILLGCGMTATLVSPILTPCYVKSNSLLPREPSTLSTSFIFKALQKKEIGAQNDKTALQISGLLEWQILIVGIIVLASTQSDHNVCSITRQTVNNSLQTGADGNCCQVVGRGFNINFPV